MLLLFVLVETDGWCRKLTNCVDRIGVVTTEVGSAFENAAFSGLVGMAYPTLARAGMHPVFDQVSPLSDIHFSHSGLNSIHDCEIDQRNCETRFEDDKFVIF